MLAAPLCADGVYLNREGNRGSACECVSSSQASWAKQKLLGEVYI